MELLNPLVRNLRLIIVVTKKIIVVTNRDLLIITMSKFVDYAVTRILGQDIDTFEFPNGDLYYDVYQALSVIGEDFSEGFIEDKGQKAILDRMGFTSQVKSFTDDYGANYKAMSVEDCCRVWAFCHFVKGNERAGKALPVAPKNKTAKFSPVRKLCSLITAK